MKKYNKKISKKEYREIQIARARAKWSSSGFYVYRLKHFQKVLDVFTTNYGMPKVIGCMGIRFGNEYTEFKKYIPSAQVHGIDICPEVVDVGENCYAYDFNNLPRNWKNKFDLIYSNSLDHSGDIEKTLNEWYRVGSKYMIITLSKNGEPSASDIYTFEKEDIYKIFADERFKILNIFDDSNLTAIIELI